MSGLKECSKFREAIKRAFDAWSDVVPLEFVEARSPEERADIKIKFVRGEHGDMMPFDNKGKHTTLHNANR